jgi:predicted ATP-grasp superfamily ATP-dependent carboligase
VVVADSNRWGMCQASRYPAAKRRYTSHYEREEDFLRDIETICAEEGVELILPSHNETEILARHRERFPYPLNALLPDAERIADFNNKARAYELASAAGVPVPARCVYSSLPDLEAQLKSSRQSGYVIKLLTGNSAKGVFYAENPEDTVSRVQTLIQSFSLQPDRYPQVEERVQGDGWGCSCLFWEGEEVATFCHRRLREKTENGGTSTFRESAWNQDLVDHAHRLLQGLAWHGLAMVEFKVNSDTGQIWFIEVNPRLWGSIHLAIDSGVEFPYLAWLCAKEGPDAARKHFLSSSRPLGRKARWLLGDMILSLSHLRHGRLREAGKTLFRQSADSCDDWNRRDPMAFLGELAYYGSTFLKKSSLNPVEEGMIG